MRVLDLFSGIGGFSLGLERAGMETVAFCEIEDYPVKILNKHWPDVPVHRDIRKLDGKQYRDSVELVCGGFPCQPFSVAGKQKGKEDNRHLWPEMLRIIKEVRPTWVVGENVAGFIRMALDDVLLDLEAEGYTTQSFVIPACAVGGIHRRDRVWIVAYADELTNGKQFKHEKSSQPNNSKAEIHDVSDTKSESGNGSKLDSETSSTQESKPRDSNSENATDTSSIRQSTKRPYGESIHTEAGRERQTSNAFNATDGRIRSATQSTVRHRDDGLPDNVARLKALGNAVVPQIPEIIGRAIMEQA